MRILYHHRTQGEEPEAIHIAAIVDALRALGHEVRTVGPAPVASQSSGDTKPSLLGRVKRAAPRLIFELLQLAYNLVVYFRIRRAILEFQPDLIYERYALFNFAGVLLARHKKIPLILEVNTPYAQAWAQYFDLYLRRLARWIEKRTLLAAGHIVTVTQVQERMLIDEGVPAARISVCHNAIDPAWFDPVRHHDPRVRERLGLNGIVVGFVGTMNRWQGIPEFPKVLREVLRTCEDVCFLFVGDGEFRSQLEDYCRAEGLVKRVVFTGRKPHADIPALVAAMDIAILLNSNEYGSPMKIFEYLGMGKAVIAPAVAPLKEVLREGETGLLIAPGSAAEMAQAIIRLVEDPALRSRLGTAGRAYVTANHTWHQNAIKTLDAYRQMTLQAAKR